MNYYLSSHQHRWTRLLRDPAQKPIRNDYARWVGHLLLASLFIVSAFLVPSAQAATTSAVAYVFDFGSGVNDTLGSSNGTVFPGSSIFTNVLTTGSPLPNSGSYNGVTFTNVPIATIDANPATALSGFDTVLLYQVCSINSHPAALSAVNTFLVNGGKVIILDGDRCALGEAAGPADWSGFLFPFTSSGPGPTGGNGSYTFLEPNTLTTGLSLGPQPDDAVADANVFTSAAGAWCTSIIATNLLGDSGRVEAYARTSNGGVAIYSGEDFWFTYDAANSHLKTVFDNILAQTFNPDGLPCTTPVTGIKLEPLTATNPIGTSHTVTATVVDSNLNPQAGVIVTFNVISGPDVGVTGTSTTDSTGQATFTFTNTTTPGTDVVIASFTDNLGIVWNSNEAQKIWTPPVGCTILDDFNRSDGHLGVNWNGRTLGYRIRSNQVAVRDGGPIYWQPASYGPDQEACVTLTRINPKNRQHGLLLKVQELNNWRKGAILVSYNARSGNVDVKARDVGIHRWVLAGSLTPATPVVDGDQLRAKALADGTVEVFINDTSIGTADAGSFYANKGGQIGLWFRGAQGRGGDDDENSDDRSTQAKKQDDDEDDDSPGARRALLDDFGGGTIMVPGPALSCLDLQALVPFPQTFPGPTFTLSPLDFTNPVDPAGAPISLDLTDRPEDLDGKPELSIGFSLDSGGYHPLFVEFPSTSFPIGVNDVSVELQHFASSTVLALDSAGAVISTATQPTQHVRASLALPGSGIRKIQFNTVETLLYKICWIP